ncbi:MAG TPA: lysylphosphatidylglycerol synthase transmembrane domain-containing protein [Smithella sp.]|nr:flippase-like domain-containing protein [Smithella sp.]MDM7988366.1 lysylphosphatidylglycerol synthase transmembrane domain-containing protein [Smithella sp.]HNY49848.1 lysylphosphatidylglycerol synthase transmembrane domain-containing protein [Smithella sp.]HOG89660.1 lysylphosphatidylglycerol synthase transmembrane domain-containing protein [Smithella sp.]HOU50686.1 lysylphosphatidylglycerol synthase transmembrane domain-containing protein [Smithella sp.]
MENTGKISNAQAFVEEMNLPREERARSFLMNSKIWKRLLPIAVSCAILFYLFWYIDIRQCFNALMNADMTIYVPAVLVLILATFLLDTQNLAATLKHFHYPLSWKNAFTLRGVTYLIMTIDYSVGLGVLIYYLKKHFGIPVMRSTGLMAFFNGITQKALVYMAIIGLIILSPTSALLRNLLIFLIGFAILDILLIVVLKKLPSRGLALKIRNLNLLKVFHEASWRTYGMLLFWRMVYYAFFIAFFYVAVRAFNMQIPLIALLAYVPIILLVISLPIAPGGFGTAQAAMLILFKDYGTNMDIMAFGLTYTTSILVLRYLIGLSFAKHIKGIPAGEVDTNKQEI